MRRWRPRRVLSAGLAVAGLGLTLAHGVLAKEPPSGGIAYSIELQATIDPATEKWVESALNDAADENAALAIIRLDTPGGLDSSLRSIVQDMLAAPMPVVVYVSPQGARAASAGAYITEAADVAAMAPATNIGSATPIAISPGGESDLSGTLGRKILNDSAASLRGLAPAHGRNPALAERMVRDATNVTAEEALRANLVDVISPSEDALLRQLDGFRVKGPKAQTLHTAGLRIETHDMPLQYDLLELLVNPTVSYLLLLAGLLGLGIELFSPGAIVPGAFGVVSFLLGLYGTAQLPVTAAGVLLLVAGIGLIVAEAHLPAHGILGASGVASIVASGLLLYDTNSDAFEVSTAVVVVAGRALGGLLALAGERTIRARRLPVRTGWEEMLGAEGEVRVPLEPVGQVFVEGALWRARPIGEGEAIGLGSRVRVEAVEGLTLHVRPVREGAMAVNRAEEGAS
jgi:membrane-bound serine protease (ClpP class)